MNMELQWDDKRLLYGLSSLTRDVNKQLDKSACRLDEDAKKAWRNTMGTKAKLSNGKRKGREWFSFDSKKWYITNRWHVPDVVYAGRNYILDKRRQADGLIGRLMSKRKQEELDNALEKAIATFETK